MNQCVIIPGSFKNEPSVALRLTEDIVDRLIMLLRNYDNRIVSMSMSTEEIMELAKYSENNIAVFGKDPGYTTIELFDSKGEHISFTSIRIVELK